MQAEFDNPITGNFTGLNGQNYPRVASAGTAAAVVWQQTVNGADQAALFFTDTIANGLPAVYDTVGDGSVINVDVAMTAGVVHVVWQDDNTGTVMYRKGTYTVQIPTSVTALTNDVAVHLFPNPAHNVVTVQWNETKQDFISADIIDLTGRTIMNLNSPANGKLVVNTSKLTAADYFIRLTDKAGKTSNIKLVIQ